MRYIALEEAFSIPELAELSVPLYLPPGAPPADHWKVLDRRPELYGATWSWAAETGGHALRVIYGAVFDRHPRATLILGQAGVRTWPCR